MKVTLSIRTKVHPPLTRDRARLIARIVMPKEDKVLVSGGNKAFLTFRSSEFIKPDPIGRDRNQSLMRVVLRVWKTIGAKETLTRLRVRRLVDKLDTEEDIIRLEGGKYTYLSIFEDGWRSIYRLGRCRMCGRDTLGSDEYCGRCLPRKVDGDEEYYSFNSCAQMLIELARGWAIKGGMDKEETLEGLVELVQVQWNAGRRI